MAYVFKSNFASLLHSSYSRSYSRVGLVRGGARSWIGIGAFSIQPSEFMKFAMIIFLAKFLAERQKLITSFKRGLLPALGFVFLAFGMIMLQPDLGTGTVMVGTCIIMIFISGARVFHFAMFGLLGVAGFVGLIASAPYRMKRITSYLDPWSIRLEVDFKLFNRYSQLDGWIIRAWTWTKSTKVSLFT